jgi:hypothetical protein
MLWVLPDQGLQARSEMLLLDACGRERSLNNVEACQTRKPEGNDRNTSIEQLNIRLPQLYETK